MPSMVANTTYHVIARAQNDLGWGHWTHPPLRVATLPAPVYSAAAADPPIAAITGGIGASLFVLAVAALLLVPKTHRGLFRFGRVVLRKNVMLERLNTMEQRMFDEEVQSAPKSALTLNPAFKREDALAADSLQSGAAGALMAGELTDTLMAGALVDGPRKVRLKGLAALGLADVGKQEQSAEEAAVAAVQRMMKGPGGSVST